MQNIPPLKTNISPLKIDGWKTNKNRFRILVQSLRGTCYFSDPCSASPPEAMEIPEVLAAQFELLAEAG